MLNSNQMQSLKDEIEDAVGANLFFYNRKECYEVTLIDIEKITKDQKKELAEFAKKIIEG